MKVFPRFKFLSRAVVHEENQDEHVLERNMYPVVTKGGLCTSSSLTVWKKSLLMNCKGFTVIDSCGNLVYRVDNYSLHPQELVLMDASGNSLLTMRRHRKLGLVDNWCVYEGDLGNHCTRRTRTCRTRKSPVCCVTKSVNILNGNSNVQAYVYRVASGSDNRRAAFTVEGSYAQRTCKVLDECKKAVAEIKRKETNTKDVSFGVEIFQLVAHPGFDPGFAMALVLVLDQMFS
ncbi:protein LURP-one-related 17 [Vicia villosa]|uniref:protein LURP-one-related 17 n=1 Tax=Vicia villosa TaxID=3911 RepID=UPI00273CBF86|nr:protein LURP-one-related 17 [Vicia villosa]